MTAKAWYESKTIWAGLLTILVAGGQAGIEYAQENKLDIDPTTAMVIAQFMAGAVAIKGRLDADDAVFTPEGLPGKNKAEVVEVPVEVQLTNTVDSAESDEIELDLTGGVPGEYELVVLQETVLKTSTTDSLQLDSAQLTQELLEGQEVQILSWERAENNHIQVQLAERPELQLYAYIPHVKLMSATGNQVSLSTPTYQEKPKTPMNLPGGETVFLEDPIVPNGHFYWYEATKSGARVPVNVEVVNGIRRIAKRLEQLRRILGKPMIITSWYRDPVTNRRVGGASRSWHLKGCAVDFAVPGMSPGQVQRLLDGSQHYWKGGLGYGRTFTHVDDGPTRRWNY